MIQLILGQGPGRLGAAWRALDGLWPGFAGSHYSGSGLARSHHRLPCLLCLPHFRLPGAVWTTTQSQGGLRQWNQTLAPPSSACRRAWHTLLMAGLHTVCSPIPLRHSATPSSIYDKNWGHPPANGSRGPPSHPVFITAAQPYSYNYTSYPPHISPNITSTTSIIQLSSSSFHNHIP